MFLGVWCVLEKTHPSYTVVKADGATPKGGLVRGHNKPIHGSCAIYFPGGIVFFWVGIFLVSHSRADEMKKTNCDGEWWFGGDDELNYDFKCDDDLDDDDDAMMKRCKWTY